MVRWNVFISSRQFLLAADGAAAAAAAPSWVAKAVPRPVVGHVHARVRAEEEREVLDIAGWQRGGESPGRCLACRIGKPTTLDEGLG